VDWSEVVATEQALQSTGIIQDDQSSSIIK